VRSRQRLIDTGLWVASAAVIASVLILSLIPQPPIGGPRPLDLLLHVAAYAPTALLLLLAGVWRAGRGMGQFPRSTFGFIGGLIVFGGALEAVQALGWAGPRQGEAADALANAMGVGSGGAVWWLLRARG
jgi:hypothetical protein